MAPLRDDHDHSHVGGKQDHDHHHHGPGGHHHHHHGHHHGPVDYTRAFGIGIALNLGFVIVETIYGFRAHSMALVADAGHNLSDVAGLGLAWAATWLGRRLPSPRFTYGLRRSSVLAATANGILLLVATGAIVAEAIRRLFDPHAISTGTMAAVAAVGIVINTFTALLFRGGHRSDLNLRAAYLHMAADAAIAAGVVVAGLLIGWTGWLWLDPVVSLAISAAVVYGTWGLLKASVNLALDAVPEHIDFHAVERYLSGVGGVQGVHDLHIWAMSTTEVALTAHLVRPAGLDDDAMLGSVSRELHDRFGIEHATIQVERGDGTHHCGLESATVV